MKDELIVEGECSAVDVPQRVLPKQKVTTCIRVVDHENGSIELKVECDLPTGEPMTNGMALAQRMTQHADQVMQEALYLAQSEANLG